MSARTLRHISNVPHELAARASGAAAGITGPDLPPKPDEMSWRDYLVMLLHIAAELEHGLMVEYLFAAYSIGGPGADRYPDRMHVWRDAILTVAREEMGHLMSVQNVLLLVGGPVSFDRQEYPWTSPFYPFPFRLERLSFESLACYVYAEMPLAVEETDPPDPMRTRQLERVIRDVRGMAGKWGGTPVGEVYDRIIWLIGQRDLIPDSTFDPDSYKYQANWEEWGRGIRPDSHKPYARDPSTPPAFQRKSQVIVARMATRTDAVKALRDVAGQGEAPHQRRTKMEKSHFERFADIFIEYQRILKKDPEFVPSWPVAVNPYAGDKDSVPEGSTPISAPASRAWASLFNIRYRMLLTLLTYTFRVPRDAPESAGLRRAPMLARTFGEMYNLKAIAGVLVRLPAKRGGAERAGPPFQMPYTLSPPMPEANFWRLQLDLLDASDALVEALMNHKAHHLPAAPPDGARYLRALRAADRDARTWIDELLVGITPSRRPRA